MYERSLEIISGYILSELKDHQSFPYVPGEYRFNWDGFSVVAHEPIDYNYEERLQQTFLNAHNRTKQHDNRPLLLVGGRGSGKSTTTLRTLLMSGKALTTDFIILDFNNFIEPTINEEEYPLLEDRFYTHVAESIRGYFPRRMDISTEISGFLPWLLEGSTFAARMTAHVTPLAKFLQDNEAEIIAISTRSALANKTEQQLFDEIYLSYKDVKIKFSAKERAWYAIMFLIYSANWSLLDGEISQKVMVFDNIDPIDPRLQNEFVYFTQIVTRATGIQVVLPMRPHTKTTVTSNNKDKGNRKKNDGTDWNRRELHCTPSVTSVIIQRLKQASAAHRGDQIESVCEKFIDLLDTHYKHLDTIIRGVSGSDLRSGLISFSNFFEVMLKRFGVNFIVHDIHVSTIARIYFCGERRFFESLFDNIYVVNVRGNRVFSPIKPTIYDIIHRAYHGKCSYGKLRSILDHYEFEPDVIDAALNDMLKRNRSLIWSNDGFFVHDFSPETSLMIAPLGDTYFHTLYGDYLYAEVCLGEGRAVAPDGAEILDFERSYVNLDLLSFRNFCRNAPKDLVSEIATVGVQPLMVRHWNKFRKGIVGRRLTSLVVDPNRDSWLSKKYREAIKINSL